MRTPGFAIIMLCGVAAAAQAQTSPIPPVDQQIAAAVRPLPEELRADAAVLGYKVSGRLEVIRAGSNGMRCLALYVVRSDFHVACYHEGLEAFMARGRALRDGGMTDARKVDSARYAEIDKGTLKMPAQGALYSLTGPKTSWNPDARTISGARPLAVLYIPFATTASTGITSRPATDGSPWLMLPGTAKAHVMMVGEMR